MFNIWFENPCSKAFLFTIVFDWIENIDSVILYSTTMWPWLVYLRSELQVHNIAI